ncbi:phosphotransferase [Gordonia jinghuaiqii]|uniref:Phosphotransferase family protein n=1 Tax=Gordonia jinghuaiqii TaxID=2758710 RepID=A0A7D7LY55_9ACTN|nr:phosphotransferase family protein [Gordonia jinghuaiqii]MCR5980601.1 phosphotransferase [Gordonia jinghuaiqii]QMT02658.1 phosphotransferase family protein [Gordonia jinghuaiqii]
MSISERAVDPDCTADELVTVRAVREAIHAEIAAGAGAAETILASAVPLFHRALEEDLRPERRVAHRTRVAEALSAFGFDPDAGADPYCGVVERVASIATDPASSAVRMLLESLVAADLPGAGRTIEADGPAAGESEGNSLGEELTSAIRPDAVRTYLAARLGRDVRVRSVKQLAGGLSKKTTLLTIDGDAAAPEEIVLRQVAPGRDAHTLIDEFAVVGHVFGHGVAVPEPLWLEPQDNALGGPFFATRRARGANVGDVFGPDPGTTPKAAEALARELGNLHALAIDGAVPTPVPPMATRGEILDAIDEQRRLVRGVERAIGIDAAPLGSLLFEWLAANAPTGVETPVLLHGDPGFHNILLDGEELTAMLDWERARIGDPAQDLAYVRPAVENIFEWEDFLRIYCEAGGRRPTDQQLAYYAVWHDAWRFVGSYRGLGRLVSEPRTLLDALLGLDYAPRYLRGGLEKAFEVAL